MTWLKLGVMVQCNQWFGCQDGTVILIVEECGDDYVNCKVWKNAVPNAYHSDPVSADPWFPFALDDHFDNVRREQVVNNCKLGEKKNVNVPGKL